MVVRSSLQLSVFFVIFLVLWRLRSWAWRVVATAFALLFAVYYKEWPFEASRGELWIDAAFAAICALLCAVAIPKPDEKRACGTCHFFVLAMIPLAMFGYSDAYIPQTQFAVGVYLATVVTASLCVLQDIVCPKSYNLHVLRPASVFVWAIVAPNIRFFPVSMALATTILSSMLLPRNPIFHQEATQNNNENNSFSVCVASSTSEDEGSELSDSDEQAFGPHQDGIRKRLKLFSNID